MADETNRDKILRQHAETILNNVAQCPTEFLRVEVATFIASHFVQEAVDRQEQMLHNEQAILSEQKTIQDRQVVILNDMGKDSKVIKRWAKISGVLAVALLILTCGLIYYATRLDKMVVRLQIIGEEMHAAKAAPTATQP